MADLSKKHDCEKDGHHWHRQPRPQGVVGSREPLVCCQCGSLKIIPWSILSPNLGTPKQCGAYR